MRRAAAPMCSARTASPSTPGPTIITAPFLLEELWTLCGAALRRRRRPAADARRSTGIRFDDGDDCSTAPATRTRCAPRSRASSPADVAGYERFMQLSEEICRIGFEQLGHVPFGSLTDMARMAPDLMRLQGYRSVYGLVAKLRERPAAAHRLQLPSAADRRQSVHRQRDLQPDRLPGAALGRAFRHGRHRRAGARAGRADRRAGRHGALQRRGRADHRGEPARATGVHAGHPARRSRPTSSCPTPTPPGPTGTCCRRSCAGALDRPEARAVALLDEPVRLVFRHQPPLSRRRRITRSCSGRAIASCCADIFERKVLADDFSLYLHRPTATDPSLAPPGCDAFYVLSPVPHLDSGDRLERRRPSRIGAPSRRFSSDTLLPGLEQQVVTLADHDAAGFPRPAARLSGRGVRAGAGADRKAPGSGRITAAKMSNGSISSARAPIPAPGVPGVLSSARVLDTVVPDAHDLVWTAPIASSRLISPPAARCCAAARAPSSPPRSLLPRRVRDAVDRALCVLPPGRRRDRPTTPTDGAALARLRERLDARL